MTLTLRYMRMDDVPEVVKIDRMAFSTPWSAQSYAYEITESNYSYMVVLEHAGAVPITGWRRWWNRFNGGENGFMVQHHLVGYGGLWNIADEAHVSTIATHPNWRGQGYGEVLLAGMVERSISLGASYVVLEVRVSNTTAQNLYHKYEFKQVLVKPNYYRDDMEDAYEMHLMLDDESVVRRSHERFALLHQRIDFNDRYTAAMRPNHR